MPSRECMYCQMAGTMEEEPILFVCQCCQSAFCKTCFIEQSGEEDYQDIIVFYPSNIQRI